MGVFKEIPKADGSGITTFYRLDNDKDTVETTSTGGTETMIDYNKALNKPSINNVVLVGNKTLDELGIQPKGDYITEVPSEYITEEELNQKQYATESYVLDKIANIEHFSRQVVDELPLVGKDNVIYLVRKEGAGDDIYNEYIWTGTSYELFGSTATDLTDYYNKDSVNELLDTKVDKQEGKGLSSNDYTNAEKSKLASLENYDDSELRAAIDSLHNYDDTEIRQEINKLSNESEAMSEKIEDIDKTNDYKLEAVRLIKSGDYWIWKDSADNLIDYFKARDLLGTENCILIMEQLDSDGKSIPADYKIDGDRIRILYKDLENLNHEMYMGPPDKDEVEGTDVIVDNGAEATLFDLSGDGKSEQVTTTGKNKIGFVNNTAIDNGLTITFADDNTITINGTSTTNLNKQYKILQDINKYVPDADYTAQIFYVGGSLNGSNERILFCIRGGLTEDTGSLTVSGYFGASKSQNYEQAITQKSPSDEGYMTAVQIMCNEGITFDNLKLKFQFEEGSTSTEFEPYTGSQPSPSPDYPQPINSIEGSLEFECRGKNYTYLDHTKYSQNCTIENDIATTIELGNYGWANIGMNKVKLSKGVYYLSADIRIKSGACNKMNYLRLGSSNFTSINNPTMSNDFQRYVFSNELLEKLETWSFGIQVDIANDAVLEIKNIMISKENSEYEPYQSNQATFNLGHEKLRSVGDVKDELIVDLDTGDYYKVENVGEVVLDGSVDFLPFTGDTDNGINKYGNVLFVNYDILNEKRAVKPYTEYPTVISNYFKEIEENIWIGEKVAIDVAGSQVIFVVPQTLATTSEEFGTWLQQHNVVIDYRLENPQTVPLGTLPAEDLAKLSTFDGYNNLFINTNLGYMNIRVTYSTNTNYNENIILGDDSYYYGIVDNKQSLPEGKAKGTLCQTKDTKDFYIYNGEEWVPVDKTASFDLSNYLSKDNTTPYSPSDRYNPATKQYVDTNIQGLRIPTKVSQLENDSKYITENTNTLVNYYNKNNTYNKKEVDALIDSSGITPVSVTLNGQKTTDANFYAPASGGTASQILISQGDAAPVWQNNTAVQTVNQDIKLVISNTQPEAPSSGFILWVDSTK